MDYVKRVLGLYGGASHDFDENLTDASFALVAGGAGEQAAADVNKPHCLVSSGAIVWYVLIFGPVRVLGFGCLTVPVRSLFSRDTRRCFSEA